MKVSKQTFSLIENFTVESKIVNYFFSFIKIALTLWFFTFDFETWFYSNLIDNQTIIYLCWLIDLRFLINLAFSEIFKM